MLAFENIFDPCNTFRTSNATWWKSKLVFYLSFPLAFVSNKFADGASLPSLKIKARLLFLHVICETADYTANDGALAAILIVLVAWLHCSI